MLAKSAGLLHILVLIWFVALQQTDVWAELDDDSWVEPLTWSLEDNTFGRYNELQCNKCPLDGLPTSEDAVALLYYKKFIIHLFSRKKLEYDKTTKSYKRAVLFTLAADQLRQLEELNDPRDLDSVLTQIFTKSRTIVERGDSVTRNVCRKQVDFLGPFLDFYKDFWQFFAKSEVRFLIIVAVVFLGGALLHRRYAIGIASMILIGFLSYGYIVTYLECNRKLELEEMMDGLNEQHQPTSGYNLFTIIKRIFGFGAEAQQHDKIKKAAKLKLPYCRPDHVLIIYFSEIYLKIMGFLLEECIATLVNLNNKLYFPMNYVAVPALIFLLGFTLKLIFKYMLTPSAWRRSTDQTHHAHATRPLPHTSMAAIDSDRISGDNLTVLLNALQRPAEVVIRKKGSLKKLALLIENSGVQELPSPPLEPARKKPSPRKHTNNNSSPQCEHKEKCIPEADVSTSNGHAKKIISEDLPATAIDSETSVISCSQSTSCKTCR